MQAGMAFSNASVALVHGMARPLGACFHLTDGLSIAVLLPVVTEFSLSAAPERYAQVAHAMGATDVVAAIRELNQDVAIPSLRQLGVEEGHYESLLEKMAADALASGSPGNNPRVPASAEIVALYRQGYANG
jgi:alcohol dehydrogenase class IV